MTTEQQIEQVGSDLGVGAQRALVAKLLEVTAVDAIARYLAVMHDRPVQQRERVSAAPPSRSVGREAIVPDPGMGLILLQQVVVAYLLGESHTLEGTHVLAAGGHERAVQARVDQHDRVNYEVLGRHLGTLDLVRIGDDEVAPQQRSVADTLDGPRRHGLGKVDHEVLVEDGLGLFLGFDVVIHHVEAEVIRELRIDAVAGKSCTQAVAPVALHGHRPYCVLAAHQRPGLVTDADQATSAVDLEGCLFCIARTRLTEETLTVGQSRHLGRWHPL